MPGSVDNPAGWEGEGLAQVSGSDHEKKGGGQTVHFFFLSEEAVVAALRADNEPRGIYRFLGG